MHNTSGPEPTILTIFGITGDLSQRYLLPALYHLFKEGLLPEHTQILGLTRQDLSPEELFGNVELCINEVDKVCDPVALKAMLSHTSLMKFDPSAAGDYDRLKTQLDQIETHTGVCMNRLYYLSIPPRLFSEAVANLGAAGLNGSCQHGTAQTRLLVEKPFGSDLASAEKLIHDTSEVFQEEQIFRIDHYLAKQTVQNILTFRAHNPIFTSIWQAGNITAIDILASEKIGIENRVQFYEGVGALRDFVQSHLLQLLAIVTMELPADISDAEAIHAAKHRLFEAVLPADPATTVRGQYEGYTQEVSNTASTTETFVKLPLTINNDRWRTVPMTITTGKALSEKRTEVSVSFGDPNDDSDSINTLHFRIQPNEGIGLELRVKKPSFGNHLENAAMDFSYATSFKGNTKHPDAYERVLVDAVKGDRTLFATSEEVLLSWKIIEPLLTAWEGNTDGLKTYSSGSAGPV